MNHHLLPYLVCWYRFLHRRPETRGLLESVETDAAAFWRMTKGLQLWVSSDPGGSRVLAKGLLWRLILMVFRPAVYIPILMCSVVSCSLPPFGLSPARLLCTWGFSGKNTGVGCHFLFQGIFLTQGWNQHLLHLLRCRRILCLPSRWGRVGSDFVGFQTRCLCLKRGLLLALEFFQCFCVTPHWVPPSAW